MPAKGQILVNPINGDSYEFVETAQSSHGDRVVVKTTVKGKGQFVPDHFHALQDEKYEVISGQLTIRLDGKTFVVPAGDSITLTSNVPHNHYNNDDIPVSYIHTVTPALDFDYLIENLVGLAADGKSKKGRYGLVQELVTLKYLDSKSFLTGIPPGIQKILMNTVAPVGRLFGYRAIYKKYSGIEK